MAKKAISYKTAKRSIYVCRKCENDFGSAISLSRHYDKVPSHMDEKARKARAQHQASKNGKPKGKWGKRAEPQPKAVGVCFCPRCGLNLERLSAISDML